MLRVQEIQALTDLGQIKTNSCFRGSSTETSSLIFSQACITVEWSLPPNFWPISGKESLVSSLNDIVGKLKRAADTGSTSAIFRER